MAVIVIVFRIWIYQSEELLHHNSSTVSASVEVKRTFLQPPGVKLRKTYCVEGMF